jgi:hypothetical protein
MHLDVSNRFHADGAGIMECPHCRRQSHMTATATPDFRILHRTRPATTGVVFHCDACETPVFVALRLTALGDSRIDFQAVPKTAEKSEERFGFSYIPNEIESLYREALGCYRNNLFTAFGAMCRLTAQKMFSELGDDAKLRIFDQVDEIARIADLDEELFSIVRNIIFDTRNDSLLIEGGLDRNLAAILLETMKDMLHQTYIRRGRLRKALQMRQFFAGQSDEAVAEAENETTRIATLVDHERPTGTG